MIQDDPISAYLSPQYRDQYCLLIDRIIKDCEEKDGTRSINTAKSIRGYSIIMFPELEVQKKLLTISATHNTSMNQDLEALSNEELHNVIYGKYTAQKSPIHYENVSYSTYRSLFYHFTPVYITLSLDNPEIVEFIPLSHPYGYAKNDSAEKNFVRNEYIHIIPEKIINELFQEIFLSSHPIGEFFGIIFNYSLKEDKKEIFHFKINTKNFLYAYALHKANIDKEKKQKLNGILYTIDNYAQYNSYFPPEDIYKRVQSIYCQRTKQYTLRGVGCLAFCVLMYKIYTHYA